MVPMVRPAPPAPSEASRETAGGSPVPAGGGSGRPHDTGGATVALVGNAVPGRDDPDRSDAIDAHAEVWRFNNAPGMAGGKQGRRTTLVWMVNSGGSMRERLEMGAAFLAAPVMRGAPAIAFPVHPAMLRRYHPEPDAAARAAGDRNDWTTPALEHFGGAGHAVTVLPATHYEAACGALGMGEAERRRRFPSTGFLAAHWLLASRPGVTASVYGFTWAGWDAHAWAAERDWFAARAAEGRLRLVAQEGA